MDYKFGMWIITSFFRHAQIPERLWKNIPNSFIRPQNMKAGSKWNDPFATAFLNTFSKTDAGNRISGELLDKLRTWVVNSGVSKSLLPQIPFKKYLATCGDICQ